MCSLRRHRKGSRLAFVAIEKEVVLRLLADELMVVPADPGLRVAIISALISTGCFFVGAGLAFIALLKF
jgi:hypothetical protein